MPNYTNTKTFNWKSDDLSNSPTSEEIEKCLFWTKEETSDWWNHSNTDEKVERKEEKSTQNQNLKSVNQAFDR